jgi:hypothetical protein
MPGPRSMVEWTCSQFYMHTMHELRGTQLNTQLLPLEIDFWSHVLEKHRCELIKRVENEPDRY